MYFNVFGYIKIEQKCVSLKILIIFLSIKIFSFHFALNIKKKNNFFLYNYLSHLFIIISDNQIIFYINRIMFDRSFHILQLLFKIYKCYCNCNIITKMFVLSLSYINLDLLIVICFIYMLILINKVLFVLFNFLIIITNIFFILLFSY